MGKRRITQVSSAKPATQLSPTINVTPLVDVVLVLLIIFMVIAPNLAEGVAVKLPLLTNVDEKSKLDPIEIVLTLSGDHHLDGAPISEPALEESLREMKQLRPDAPVVIKADAGVRYGQVRRLFSLAQSAGFSAVGMKVSAPAKEPTDGH